MGKESTKKVKSHVHFFLTVQPPVDFMPNVSPAFIANVTIIAPNLETQHYFVPLPGI